MNRDEIYNFFAEKGYKPEHIAGIMGNIGAESGFNPAAFNEAGGGQGALGYAQWRGPRQSALRDLAAKRGTNVEDGYTQLTHLHEELMGPENAAYQALLKTDNAADAARVFRDTYERPGGHGYKNAYNVATEVAANRGAEPGGAFQQPYRFPSSVVAPQEAPYGQVSMLDPEQLDMGMLASEVQKAQAGQDLVNSMIPSGGGLPSMALNPDAAPSPVQGPSALRSPDEFQYNAQDEAILSDPETQTVARAVADNPAAFGLGQEAAVEAKGLLDGPDDTKDEADAKAARRKQWAMMLGTLSKGLGQMSVGNAVDVMGVPMEFERMNMEQQAQENQNRLTKLQEQRRGRQLSLDEQKFLAQQQGTAQEAVARQAAAANFAANGQTELAQMTMAGVPLDAVFEASRDERFRTEDRQQALADRQADWARKDFEYARNLNADLTQAQYDAEQTAKQGQLLQNGITQMQQGVPLGQINTQGMSPATVKTMMDLTQPADRDKILARAQLIAADKGMSVGEVLYQMETKPLVDMSTKAEGKFAEQNAVELSKAHQATQDNLLVQSQIANDSDVYLAELENVNSQLTPDTTQNEFTQIASQAAEVLDSVGIPKAAQLVETFGGMSAEQFRNMKPAEQALAYAIARDNKGQGSITENERKAMLSQIPGIAGNPRARATLIRRAQLMNDIDRLSHAYYTRETNGIDSDGNQKDGRRVNIVNAKLETEIKPAMAQVSQAVQALERMNNQRLHYSKLPPKERKAALERDKKIASKLKLSEDQALFYGPILGKYGVRGYTNYKGEEVQF